MQPGGDREPLTNILPSFRLENQVAVVTGGGRGIDGRHSLTISMDQDIHYLPDIQAGMHSKGFEHALLNADEVRVQHFHDWVDQWINDN
jgi:hypothetical protein